MERIGNNILNASAEDLEKIAVDATHVALQYVKDWVINLYQNRVTSNSAKTSALKLKDLERQVRISNETIDIGIEKKEIAVTWATRKLGYTEEQTQQVLDLANEAYGKNNLKSIEKRHYRLKKVSSAFSAFKIIYSQTTRTVFSKTV